MRARSRGAPGGAAKLITWSAGDPVERPLDGEGDLVGRAGDEALAQVFVGLVQQAAERVLRAEVGGLGVPLPVGVAEVALVWRELLPERLGVVGDEAAAGEQDLEVGGVVALGDQLFGPGLVDGAVGDDHQVGAEAGGALRGGDAARADPEREGLLDRLGRDGDVFDLVVAAVEADGFAVECAGDDFERLIHQARAMAAVDAEALELLDAVAEADAEVEASIAEDIDGGGVLGDADRVVQGQQQDPGADPDARGEARDRGGDGQHGGGVAVVDEVVLGDPDVVVAKRFGELDLVEQFVVELGPGLAPLGWVAEVVDQSELGHGWLLSARVRCGRRGGR